MEGGRFLVPVLPMTMITAAIFLRAMVMPRMFRPAVWALASLQIAGTFLFARNESTGTPIWATRAGDEPAHGDTFSWLERANRIHRRDIPVAIQLNETIRVLRQRKAEPVSIQSAQMGMVIYYTALTHYPHIRILDLRGLVSDEFNHCPAIAGLRRTALGVMLSYPYLFDHIDEMKAKCQMSAPDVIFDLPSFHGHDLEALLRDNGYTIVHRQVGTVRNSSKLFSGFEIPAGQMIAVRRDLWDDHQEASLAPLPIIDRGDGVSKPLTMTPQ